MIFEHEDFATDHTGRTLDTWINGGSFDGPRVHGVEPP